ncbi:hypothetical protein Pst134EA_004774 [Puccinia striiformis f. sp. tritici]|uniref:Ubiquitin-like domain-containing protein n=1 Tax=Puccinia striiformis TaxID=27350 RepID=A0A2S4VBB0_9BASI|nr:hypothetical protein Pst134EA_004774 [Puccinia striiformis f. sp. tritici]KAH9470856.1 hypothetical protein Pst134EA_004774 [Puccinia striiformis f. sp. tritici]KAI9622848.1 hypothetical protein KEM48_009733 [Puccinia striiformis f. sp. tritici PST-130]POW06829.1 hypothetical protein PSTT_08687 [Puccinia striiformis]
MDSILPAQKLQDEINAVKRHLQALTKQQLQLANEHNSPLESRPRRVNCPQISLAEPPAPLTTESNTTSTEPIKITIKSLKPPLSFSIACSPSSTISELKKLLCESDSSAPPVEAQRLVYKGKALADSKLLKDYEAIQTGETVHLIIKPDSNVPNLGHSERPSSVIVEPGTPISEKTLEGACTESVTGKDSSEPKLAMKIPKITMEIDGSDSGEQPCISRSRSGSVHTNPMYSPHLGISESFKSVVTGDQFWISARQFLESQFVGPVDGPGEANARQLWEHWFNASKEWLSPSEIARIREATGISGMAGR